MLTIKNEDDEYFSRDANGNEFWTDDASEGTPIEFDSYLDAERIMRSLYVPFATQIVGVLSNDISLDANLPEANDQQPDYLEQIPWTETDVTEGCEEGVWPELSESEHERYRQIADMPSWDNHCE